jgi:hypothetical protein
MRIVAILVLVGCGSGDNKKQDAPMHDSAKMDGKRIDAKVFMDAPGPDAFQTVFTVTCPTSPDATVMTTGHSYMPIMTTITTNQIVEFVMPPEHNVASASPGLSVGFGETKCLKLTVVGTYTFQCSAHGFTGTIVVN